MEQSFRGLRKQYIWKNYGENKGTIQCSSALSFPLHKYSYQHFKFAEKGGLTILSIPGLCFYLLTCVSTRICTVSHARK